MSNIPLCVCVCMFLCVCLYDHSVVSVTQSCLTLGDSMDCSPPGSSVHEISQARILEWVALTVCRGSSRPRNLTFASCVYRTSQTRILEWAAIPFSRIFLAQRLNTGLLHCTQILYHLSHQGSPDSEALCDPMDCSPPGSSIQGISQTRILVWAAISSSRGSQVSHTAGRFFTI